jgi:hypothetical protein
MTKATLAVTEITRHKHLSTTSPQASPPRPHQTGNFIGDRSLPLSRNGAHEKQRHQECKE